MAPSRIILVLSDPPLPFGRAMGRWFYVLFKGLVERGHRVTAFCACTTPEEIDQSRALFPPPAYDLRCYPHEVRSGLVGKLRTLREPYSYTFSPRMRGELNAELSRGFDVLHLDMLWCGWLGLAHRDRAVVGLPFLYEIDFSDQPVTSVPDRALRLLTFRAERRLLRGYSRHIPVSPRLARFVRGVNPSADVRPIPFGMDLSLYPMLEERPEDGPPTVGLIASFNWTPGLTAGRRLLDRLWPELKRRIPEARLHLAGIAAPAMFPEHVGRPGVTIGDRVTDVLGFFRGIDLQLYAPNHSSGMKFKVLESFALGVPVVTTADGVEGLTAEDGVHAGVCEDDPGLIERAVALLTDRDRRLRQRQAARALIEATCAPGPVLDQVEAFYETIVRG
jgi:glycosyltransferase involved in cell wall biosynthesis